MLFIKLAQEQNEKEKGGESFEGEENSWIEHFGTKEGKRMMRSLSLLFCPPFRNLLSISFLPYDPTQSRSISPILVRPFFDLHLGLFLSSPCFFWTRQHSFSISGKKPDTWFASPAQHPSSDVRSKLAHDRLPHTRNLLPLSLSIPLSLLDRLCCFPFGRRQFPKNDHVIDDLQGNFSALLHTWNTFLGEKNW